MSSILSNEEYLKKVIKESSYKKEVLNKLGFKTLSGNYKTLDKYIKLYNIDISHFLTAQDSIKGNNFNKKYELNDILVKNFQGTITNSNIKNYLYKANLKKKCCEICNQNEEWNGKKLSFILDHINGDNKDNRLENLRIICPNCDSTLDTYMGRNNKNLNSQRQRNIKNKENKIYFNNLKLENIKNQLIEAHIDFSKKTWGVEVSKLLNKSPQYCLKFVKSNFKELLQINGI